MRPQGRHIYADAGYFPLVSERYTSAATRPDSRSVSDGGLSRLSMRHFAFTLAALIALPVAAQTVTDGDTIKLNGTTYRLWGIDAPESKQLCADGWPAGRAATTYMREGLDGVVTFSGRLAQHWQPLGSLQGAVYLGELCFWGLCRPSTVRNS